MQQRPDDSAGADGTATRRTASPLDDPARIAAARRLLPHLPGFPGGTGLDRVTTLAARLLSASSAQVSLLEEEQVVVAGEGLDAGAVGGRSPLQDSLCTVTAGTGAPLVVDDSRSDPRVSALPPVRSGQVGAYLGVPLVDRNGCTVGALCVHDREPRSWSDADVSLLTELSTAVLAELELDALSHDYETAQARLAMTMGAAGIGAFDLELATGRLTWDDHLLEMFGYDAGGFSGTLDAFFARLHPEDHDAVSRRVQECIDLEADLDVQYRVVLPTGQTRWVAARGRCLVDGHGRPTRLIGAAQDRTQERDVATRVARVLETMPAAFFSVDRRWRFSYINAKAEQLVGRTRDQAIGSDLWTLFPAALGSSFERHYRHAMTTGQPVEFEEYYPPPLDRWYTVQAWPGPDGLSVYFHDGTERHRALTAAERARTESERTTARTALFSRVSEQLAAERELHGALERLARLVVPALGDWCVVDELDERGQLRDSVAWHTDPSLTDLAHEVARALSTLSPTEDSYALRAVRARTSMAIPAPVTETIGRAAGTGRLLDLLETLQPHYGLVLPLIARGRTLGVLTLFTHAGRGPWSRSDLAAAEEVARRAALSLDNVRLYRQQRTLAETLQRSMLTEPPEPDHMQLAVRYVPAAAEAQVGGDWYDAFMQGDGATVVVIGDVTGHDTSSAAVMGQVRALLRGIAYTTGASPAEVLTRLDQALTGLQVDTTATLVVVRIEQTDAEHADGRTTVRWSNAGHPPPVVMHADGTVEHLEAHRSDLLLGVDPMAPRRDSELVVERDSTVLLYTDGLVERRDLSLRTGMQRLLETVAHVGTGPTLDELCDQVLARMLADAPQDDVAMVAFRLHRQGQPRPAEAGPRRLPPDVPPEPPA